MADTGCYSTGVRTPEGQASDVIVGPSRYLPWPLDAVARRGWDEVAFWYRMRRHSLPVGVAQLITASIDLAQRPRLGVFRAAAGDGLPVLVAANDPLIRHSLFFALGARGVTAAG